MAVFGDFPAHFFLFLQDRYEFMPSDTRGWRAIGQPNIFLWWNPNQWRGIIWCLSSLNKPEWMLEEGAQCI